MLRVWWNIAEIWRIYCNNYQHIYVVFCLKFKFYGIRLSKIQDNRFRLKIIIYFYLKEIIFTKFTVFSKLWHNKNELFLVYYSCMNNVYITIDWQFESWLPSDAYPPLYSKVIPPHIFHIFWGQYDNFSYLDDIKHV